MGQVLCNYHPRDTHPETTVSTPKQDKSKKAKKTPTKKTPTPKTTEEATEEIEEKQAEVTVAEPVAPVVEAEAVVETEAVVEEPVVAFAVGQKVLCCRNEEKSSGTVVNTNPLTVMLGDASFGRYAWYWDTVVEDNKVSVTEIDEIEVVFAVGQKVICCRNEEKASGTVVNTNPLTVMIDDAPFGRYGWYWDTVSEDDTFTQTEVDEIEEATELAKVEEMDKVNTDSKANLAGLLSDKLEAQKEYAETVFTVGQKVICCRNQETLSGTVVNTNPLTVMVEDAPFGRYAWYWDTVAEDNTFTVAEVDEIEEAAEIAKVEEMDKVNTDSKANLAELLTDKLEAQEDVEEQAVELAETEETKPTAVAVKETPVAETEETKPAAVAVEETPKEEVAPVEVETVTETVVEEA